MLIAFWAVIAAGLDITTKVLAAELHRRALLPHLIVQSHNPNFAMCVASARLPVMVVLSAALLLGFGAWCARLGVRGRLPAWVPGLIIGGAAANLLDRVSFGAVHDWLRVGYVDLNVADLLVLTGVISLLLYRRYRR